MTGGTTSVEARGARCLRPPSDATTVRVREDAVLLSDGPFAETKEQVGGFCLIECADSEEAIEVASKHPAAGYGAIEIRPQSVGLPIEVAAPVLHQFLLTSPVEEATSC